VPVSLDEVEGTDPVAAEVSLPAGAAPLVYVATVAGPVGASLIASSARTQPDLAVMAAGQVTCLKVTVGLSAPSNQSKRK